MENIKLQTQGTVENYQPTPNLFYDVEGKVLSKNGRELVVEKEVGSRVVEYTLNLKEEREVEEGEDIKVSKEEINSMKFEEREVLDPAYREELGQLLRKLGLADTRANYILVEKLLKLGIEPNQVNIDNYLRSMENLEKIEENLDLDTMVKIFQKGGDLETMSLEEIVLEIDRVNSGEVKIRDIFKKREIDYQEAEEICHKIYGQKMGRDIYDIIIALAREGISLSKENVNRGMETFKKLANLEKLDL